MHVIILLISLSYCLSILQQTFSSNYKNGLSSSIGLSSTHLTWLRCNYWSMIWCSAKTRHSSEQNYSNCLKIDSNYYEKSELYPETIVFCYREETIIWWLLLSLDSFSLISFRMIWIALINSNTNTYASSFLLWMIVLISTQEISSISSLTIGFI